MAQQFLVMEHPGINGVDENSFEANSFSTSAWEFFTGVVEVTVNAIYALRKYGRR